MTDPLSVLRHHNAAEGMRRRRRIFGKPEEVQSVTDHCLRASRKEVIQPQVPLRLPCYDFTPVADLTVVGYLPCGLAHRLRVKPTPMV
jgi:hypothetical protein